MHQNVSSGMAQDWVAEMRAANAQAIAAQAEESAERLDAYRKRSMRNRRWSVVSGEATAVAQQGPNQRAAERAADRILRSSENRVDNNAYRGSRLPRIAASMAAGGKGRLTADTAAQFVSSFSSQFPLAQRLAAAFLPQKVAHKDAEAILVRLAGERGFTFDPKDKGDAVAFRALMREVNPGSGRAGGRPRKVRGVAADRWIGGNAAGVLTGTYDAALVGMLVGGLPQKVAGCTCAGLSGSGYRGCAGHGYGRSVTAHPYVGYSKPDGSIVHTGDVVPVGSDEGFEE